MRHDFAGSVFGDSRTLTDVNDDWGELTGAERRFLTTMLRRLRAGGGMIAGSFCEALIAEALLGAKEPDLGAHPWDLEWDGIRIEVKMTRGSSWQVPERMVRDGRRERRRRADVYVLALHEGEGHLDGWTFYVVPTAVLDARLAKSIGVREVRRTLAPVSYEEMPDAVRAAYGARRTFSASPRRDGGGGA